MSAFSHKPEANVSTLGNGLRVITQTVPGLRTASVGVWVDVGARHEAREVNGVAHLLEHMAFKGTRRRSAQVIAETIEDVGGHLNAYTSREQTAYYARVMGEDVPLAIDLIADILRDSVMDESELARERTVVLQEIGQVNDTPDDLVFDLFQETAYPDQALGRSILGPPELIRAMPREALLGYMARHYGPNRMILAAAGAIEHDQIVTLAEAQFGDLDARPSEPYEAARYVGGERRFERDLEQAHIILGYEALPFDDDDFFALQVFSAILGGGMSSRLFQEVREKRGLVYSVFSFTSAYADTGLFGIYAGTGEDETAALMPVLRDELYKMADKVSDAELARARAQLKASQMMALESCSALSEDLARQLLIYGEPMSTDETIARIEAVDLEALRRVGARLLQAKPVLTAIGPLQNLPELA
ncbi:MAG: M16 family metallopeptidase [Geminicoccaceae bacterium]